MAKQNANARRGALAEEMVDLARRLILRATSDLSVDIHDEAHVQAREYARAASATAHFRGSPPARQDATTRGHLASRFERRITPLLETMRTLQDDEGVKPHVMVGRNPDPIYMDAVDLSVLDGGIRIVVEDTELFERVTVRDLAPPPSEADRHVLLDVVRRNGRILVVATAISNTVYGLAGVHLDDQGAILQQIEPTGAHDVAPLDEDVLERLWTIIGVGARAHGRTMPKTKKSKIKIVDAEEVKDEGPQEERPETSPQNGQEEDLDYVPLPARIAHDASADDLVRPITDAPFDDESFEAYATAMASNATTRILLDVFASGLVQGRLPVEEGDDVVLRLFRESYGNKTDQMIRSTKRRYKHVLNDPKAINAYEGYSTEAFERMKQRARDDASSSFGMRFNMLLRLLVMHADSKGPVEATEKCDGDGLATLRADTPTFGILVVKNRTFFDIARQTQNDEDDREGKTRREVPLSIVYRLSPEGVIGIVHQMDARHTNILLDFDIPAVPVDGGEDETEIDWALRNLLHDVADRRAGERQLHAVETETSVALEQDCSKPARPDDFVPGQAMQRGIPTNRLLRRHAQVTLGVEDYAAAARTVDAWFDRTAKGHRDALMLDRREGQSGWRIEHASEDDAHVWAVSVRAGPQVPPRIEIMVETTQERAESALPTLVRELAEATETCDLDGPMVLKPKMVMTRPQMRALMEELTDPNRRLPILVLTADQNGELMVDPEQIARKTAGYLRVRTVSRSMTLEMRDAWGQEFTVFNGAARIYQPGFDPERSNPLAHQRFMPGHNAHHTLANAIRREAAATLSRYHIEGGLKDDLAEAARQVAEEPDTSLDAPALPLPIVVPPVRFRPVTRVATQRKTSEEKRASPAPQREAEDPPKVSASLPVEAEKDVADSMQGEHRADVPHGLQETVDTAEEPLPLQNEGVDQDIPDPDAVEETEAPKTSDEGSGNADLPQEDLEEAQLPLQDELEARISRIVTNAMSNQNARIEAIEAHIARVERERDTALRQVDAVRERAIASARREQEEADRNRNDDAELIRIAEQEREEALAELAQAQGDLAEALSRNRMLEKEIERLRQGSASEGDRPRTLAEIGEWANSRFAGRVTILPRACKALRKSIYADVERVAQMVELFAGPYVDARNKVEGAHEQWMEGMESLRIKDYKQIDAGGPEDQQYHVRHEGRTLRLDRHIKGNESSSRERGAFRVYYTYDEQSGQVVIGWLPDHLTTAAT